MGVQTVIPDLQFLENSLQTIGQIRLAELSVYNWGSFNGLHTAPIDPQGTLITGDNGSGKSTLIDGLMALLLPAGKNSFNIAAAQGDRADRTLLSYMRGSFGTAHDGINTRTKSKRESSVITGLRALYKNDNGSNVTLAALFWTTQPSNSLSDVKRIYIAGERNLTLKEVLDVFGEGDTRALKQWLNDDPLLTCCHDNFSDYQELYRRLLYLENKNAPALLSRALGLKKIDDLTELIRTLVLEPSTIKDDVRKTVDEFSNLRAIHEKMIDARAQRDCLAKLPELNGTIEKTTTELASLTMEKSGLVIYFGELFLQLWQAEIRTLEVNLDALKREIKQAGVEESHASERVDRKHEEYLKYGGDKIESLQRNVTHAQERLNITIRQSSAYQTDTTALAIPSTLEENIFIENQASASDKIKQLQADTEVAQDVFGESQGEFKKLAQDLNDVSEEIQEIALRPDSNIDIRFQRMRDDLVQSIGLNKEQCMFLGELMDVNEQEKDWQGAIERALGGQRATLAVPYESYSKVTQWLNARHTGLYVRVRAVDSISSHYQQDAIFNPEGYLSKLAWREHPYKHWLQQYLKQQCELTCVPDTKALDQTPYSMTKEGLIHRSKGSFEKQDQYRIHDKKNWYLGFSNKSQLSLLEQEKKELIDRLSELRKQLDASRQKLASLSGKIKLWEKIEGYHWEDINTPNWQNRLAGLKSDLAALQQTGGRLDQAKLLWEAAKDELANIRAQKEVLGKDELRLQLALQNAQKEQEKAQEQASEVLPETVRELLDSRVGVPAQPTLDGINRTKSRIAGQLDQLLEQNKNKKTRAEQTATIAISLFRNNEKWQSACVDWPSGLNGLPDCLEYFQQLETDGLPNLVGMFTEHLNKHALQSLARIKTKLESEHEDILERLDTINRVLQRTEFRQGTHLKLKAEKAKFLHVQLFEQDLRLVLAQATSDDHEGRFIQLAKVIGTLEKASTTTTSHTLESLRLLDSRYQMSFKAEEIDKHTGIVKDVLASSSGKSGGEKESFAGIIVAASLAYVLTPNGHHQPAYCTVFLDEAFSNTADAVSRRVLKVFKELNIHINLITPYKNINLARESTRLLLIAERDPENHNSSLQEMTWEERDQKMHAEKEKKLQAEMHSFNIEAEPLANISTSI